MLKKGGCTSSEWARCACLVLVLEFLYFSIGSAMLPLRGAGHHEQIKLVHDSAREAADARSDHICTTNCPPLELQVHRTIMRKECPDSVVPNAAASLTTQGKDGLRRIGISPCRQNQIGSDENLIRLETQTGKSGMNSLSITQSNTGGQTVTQVTGMAHDHYVVDPNEHDSSEHVLRDTNMRASRRLLSSYSDAESFRSKAALASDYFWSLLRRHDRQQDELSSRRIMVDSDKSVDTVDSLNPTTDSTPPTTQQFLLGPPAPSALVHNEKQDWNQDYAEPDVHPPSSN